jgi:protocatechuate 3,4-dioxygenase beta subunit
MAMLDAMTYSQQLDPRRRGLRRREALTTLGGLGLTGVLGGAAAALGGGAAAPADALAAACILSAEATEGPYWIANGLTRRDIREGTPGLPLSIAFTVVDAKTCGAIAGADVEIWHCDATGEYSGFDGSGHGRTSTRYLRGHQKANAAGVAQFLTVYPGWYPGRTPHIHLKVHVGGSVVHTGQVFFSEKATASVYRQAPYRSHGQPDTSHARDGIYRQAGSSKAELRLTRRGPGGYRGAITLGVAT